MARTFRSVLLVGAFAAASVPAIASAQAVVQSLAPGDADLLATQMRALAVNPRDLNALATAGELSIKLGDLSGAAALFARADRIDPRNGRVKAGMGSILVRSERPGEALRFYQQAEASGWSASRFAADRGLAYDLIGEQRRAQADYRVALATASDDETIRRYALSLGISGKQAEALAQLDPLVRKQDRAAWRARAFVLAMGGDTPGAEKIATTMMPAGVAQGLGLFFQRLPTLPAADRAFAVHFGEIAATPERIADARLTPALAALPPETVTPVQVAAVTPQASDRRSTRRERPGRQPLSATTASATSTAPAVLAANTGSARPGFAAQPRVSVAGPTAPVPSSATVQPAATAMRESDVRVAATTVRPPTSTFTPARPATAQPVVSQPATRTTPVQVAQVAPQSLPQPVQTAAVPPPSTEPVAPVQTAAATQRADSVLARIVASLSIPATELGVTQAIPATTAPVRPMVPASVASAPRSTDGRRVVAEAAAKEARDTAVRRTVAAKLTGDADADDAKPLTPAQKRAAARQAAADKRAEELALAKMTPAQRRAAKRKAAAEAEETEVADVKLTPAQKRAADRQAAADEREAARALAKMTPAQRRAAARKAAADAAAEPVEVADAKLTPTQRRAAARKAAAEADKALTPAEKRAAARKALADKKADAEKKELADKAAADKKASRSNPSRIWVQVAGGANESDLTKAWSGVKAKSPALAARAGYSTPLRATNRVLTGPFKTDSEARAFVNQLSKQGVSAFPFTSDAGQPVTRLGGK